MDGEILRTFSGVLKFKRRSRPPKNDNDSLTSVKSGEWICAELVITPLVRGVLLSPTLFPIVDSRELEINLFYHSIMCFL